jgi:hypothetical protein
MTKNIQGYLGIISMALIVCTAKADIAYVDLVDGVFGTVDLGTGAFVQIGIPSAPGLAGLGVFNGAIYGGASLGNTVYRINQATGVLTSVGTASINFEDFGSTTAGLFAVDTSLNLYSVNAGTGATTLIGATGLSLSGVVTAGMSDNSSALYYANGTNLYSLDTGTGAPTLVGSVGSGIGIGAMLFQSGTLYGGQNHPSIGLDTIDTGTGAATFLFGVNTSGASIDGLAPVPPSAVPEPASWLFVITSAAILGLVRHRRLLTRKRSSAPASACSE